MAFTFGSATIMIGGKAVPLETDVDLKPTRLPPQPVWPLAACEMMLTVDLDPAARRTLIVMALIHLALRGELPKD